MKKSTLELLKNINHLHPSYTRRGVSLLKRLLPKGKLLVGTSRAWLGGFGELTAREVYTWGKYNEITSDTDNWKVYNVKSTANVYPVSKTGTPLWGLYYRPDTGSDNTTKYYIPREVTSSLNPSTNRFSVTSEDYMTYGEFIPQLLSNISTSGYKVYGTTQWDGAASLETDSGYTYNYIFAASSYTIVSTESYTSTGMTNFYEFTFNGNSISSYYNGYIILGTMKAYMRNGSKSSLSGTVSSDNSSAYPDNGISKDKWYEKTTTDESYSKGDYIETVEAFDPTEYPNDGYYNGYWYVKQP